MVNQSFFEILLIILLNIVVELQSYAIVVSRGFYSYQLSAYIQHSDTEWY